MNQSFFSFCGLNRVELDGVLVLGMRISLRVRRGSALLLRDVMSSSATIFAEVAAGVTRARQAVAVDHTERSEREQEEHERHDEQVADAVQKRQEEQHLEEGAE